MQEWYDMYLKLINENGIDEKMRGIYVDDGRSLVKKLDLGTRFVTESNSFEHSSEWEEADRSEMKSRDDLTETEILKAMNAINTDLQFTSETERDFLKGRLPTLSFEIWSTVDGISFS